MLSETVTVIDDASWEAAVGREIADRTSVHDDGDTLTVFCCDAVWARELFQRIDDIQARLPRRSIYFGVEGDSPRSARAKYAAYLQSDHWRSLRRWALERAGARCQLCNTSEETLHVHHRTYERLGAELPQDLTVLCASCHAKFHNRAPRG